MLDVEKIKKGLDTCALRSAGDCTSCPYFENTYCNDLLASDAAEYIESLEERIAIMQESMEALEKRCNALGALEQRCKTLEKRDKPKESIPISWLEEMLDGHPELPYAVTDGITNVISLWRTKATWAD